jgi:hypothetical protein
MSSLPGISFKVSTGFSFVFLLERFALDMTPYSHSIKDYTISFIIFDKTIRFVYAIEKLLIVDFQYFLTYNKLR